MLNKFLMIKEEFRIGNEDMSFTFLTELLSIEATRKTIDKYGPALSDKIEHDTKYKKFTSPEELIKWITSDINPTRNSMYTKWIIARYVDGSINFIEDMHKVTEPLERYSKLVQAKKIPLEKRDINQFKTMNLFLDNDG